MKATNVKQVKMVKQGNSYVFETKEVKVAKQENEIMFESLKVGFKDGNLEFSMNFHEDDDIDGAKEQLFEEVKEYMNNLMEEIMN